MLGSFYTDGMCGANLSMGSDGAESGKMDQSAKRELLSEMLFVDRSLSIQVSIL